MAMPRSPAAKSSTFGRDERLLGERGEAVAVERDDPRSGLVERRRTHDGRRARPTTAVWTPGSVVIACELAVGPLPDVELGGVVDRVGLEQDAAVADER